jgi:hypothetical protein
MFYPLLISPAFTQGGQSSRRTAGVFFNVGTDAGFVNFGPLPKTIGAGAAVTSDAFLGVGYNAFMVMLTSSAQNLTLDVNHLDPFNPGTILFTRLAVGVVAPGALTPIVFGFGQTTVAACGFDVFHTFSLTIRNATGVSTNLTAFPGLWGTAR